MHKYDRVQFADGIQGLILSITNDHGVTVFGILTDDNIQINCDPDQVGPIDRNDPDQDLEDYETGGEHYLLYIHEVNRLLWFRMAAWHDYWAKQEVKDRQRGKDHPPMGTKKHAEYWEFYQRGEIASLPIIKNIQRRELANPKQEAMSLEVEKKKEVNHDH